ncbi:hypothetical protein N0V90_008436 [Kalmusia sp. IMI 367209]|nr:hypothetical protein N0V90_008436 [Kalmusia sp. IMI 367209]
MPEYTKLKNAELDALLKERGLPHGGKKADMVARLAEDDKKKASDADPTASKAAHPEDEIDWDDEDTPADAGKGAATASAPAKDNTKGSAQAVVTETDTVAKAGGIGQPPNPQAVPNQKVDIDPSKTDDLSVKPPTEDAEASTGATAEEPKEPAPDYAQGIAATNLDTEIEKRKARAKRFGLKVEDDESLKKLERAKKFGESGPPKGLDEALPERTERKKRGREDNEDGGRNKRRGGGRAGGNRGRGDGNRDGDRRRDNRENRDNRDNRDSRDNRDNRDNRRDDRRNDRGSNWMSAADRERAEARKAKWSKQESSS